MHVHNDTVLLSYTDYTSQFQLSELAFSFDECAPGVAMATCHVVLHHSLIMSYDHYFKGGLLPPPGKNFGIFWHAGAAYLQTWAALKMNLPRPGGPIKARVVNGTVPLRVFDLDYNDVLKSKAPTVGRMVHNNGMDAVMVPNEHALLVMAHSKTEDKVYLPRFGTSYFQYFVLLDPEPPYTLQHMSPPFCIPSGVNASLCEAIQFSPSALLVPETNELVIFYGINDCEAALVRIKIKHMLAFTRREARQLQLQLRVSWMYLDGTARDSKVEVGHQAERAINTQLSNEENCRIILTRKEIE